MVGTGKRVTYVSLGIWKKLIEKPKLGPFVNISLRPIVLTISGLGLLDRSCPISLIGAGHKNLKMPSSFFLLVTIFNWA